LKIFTTSLIAEMNNGFLPTRASLMLDFVTLAMLLVSIVLAFSIYLIRVKKRPELHRNIQIATAIILVFALVAFEVDVRWITNWRELAETSPYYASGTVDGWLYFHLLFAIPTPFIWGFVIWKGLKNFKTGFHQGDYNKTHRIHGRIAAGFMFATAITGWIFYFLAFVAT
jgi:putative membrane protein